ncbi:MAG: hypothetical protein JW993_01635 [Sedimentisphaerales bacterium]|nr:hypothetical protein [Sedimentisphaerales bacterium]
MRRVFVACCLVCVVGRVWAAEPAHVSLVLADESAEQKTYRWGVTRTAPVKVVQGWFAFDEGGIRAHGGGGRALAEAQSMRLSLVVARENDYLVLNRGYGFSGDSGDQQADIANRTRWPDGAELKTYYLSTPLNLTAELQPLWKGQFVRDDQVVKSVVYAVRVVGEGVPDGLLDGGEAEALRIGRAWGPAPDPATVVYEGRTISQWIAQWDTRVYEEINRATEVLTGIGRPVVPFMVEAIQQGGPHAGYAGAVLGKMGPDAEEALDWLIETALDRGSSEGPGNIRRIAVSCLGNMTWAQERVLPVLTQIAEDAKADSSLRRLALTGLSNLGGEAMSVIEKIAASDEREMRDLARGMVSQLAAKEGQMTRAEYYTRLVEEDPFDPSVPRYLASTKGIVNSGQRHPLTEKVKALHRQRLQEKPDPELAWTLAQIIQNGLLNTALEWAAPTRSSRGRSDREDPSESFVTLAEALELGFAHAQAETPLRENLGIALAKLRLLQGDWDGMNATLAKLGQEPVPSELQPWLPAPPADWAVGLASHWRACAESMRSGDCALEFRIEKDGKGLAGAHVLVKRAPEQTNVYFSGIEADTLFLAPYPVGDARFSFGYRGQDREETRYALSGDSGIVRFEKLPDIPIKVEVLVPTSNLPESRPNWDLWMEVEPGVFKLAKPYGGPDAVSPIEPPAVVTLQPGQTVRYPKLVVRSAFGLNVMDMDRVETDSFVLSWQGLDAALQQKVACYELEMSLSAPTQHPSLLDTPGHKVRSATHTLKATEWPVGTEGVGGLQLGPGNIYMFEVKAVDDANTVLARWPKTRVWTPWGYRRTDPPLSRLDVMDGVPIYHGVWHRGTFSYGDGREETLPERVERFLRERPDAFEYDYVRLGKAWLDWHAGDAEGARTQLNRLAQELPKGNLARGTAVSLLQRMAEGAAPPRRLDLVPDKN